MDIIDSPKRLMEMKEKFKSEIDNSCGLNFGSRNSDSDDLASLRFAEMWELYEFARKLNSSKKEEGLSSNVLPMFMGSISITRMTEVSVRELLLRIS